MQQKHWMKVFPKMFFGIQKLIRTIYKLGGIKEEFCSVMAGGKINFELETNLYSFETGKARGLSKAINKYLNDHKPWQGNPLGDSCQIFLQIMDRSIKKILYNIQKKRSVIRSEKTICQLVKYILTLVLNYKIILNKKFEIYTIKKLWLHLNYFLRNVDFLFQYVFIHTQTFVKKYNRILWLPF